MKLLIAILCLAFIAACAPPSPEVPLKSQPSPTPTPTATPMQNK